MDCFDISHLHSQVDSLVDLSVDLFCGFVFEFGLSSGFVWICFEISLVDLF